MSKIDFAALNKAALAHCPGLLERLLPGGKATGKYYFCSNLTGGNGRSFTANLETGGWGDNATGEKGGDLISLVAAMDGVNQYEAARRLADMVNYSLQEPGAMPAKKRDSQQGEKPQPIMPVPESAASTLPDMRHITHGKPTETYTYRNEKGQLLGYVCRFAKQEIKDNGKHKKEFAPLTYTNRGWRWQGFPEPYPFYGLENLLKFAHGAKILIVEGEHKADTVKSLSGQNMAILGLYGGCGKTGKMDLTPLQGRDVVYWPDNDQPGFDAAIAFAQKVMLIAASVKIVMPPADKKETWDLADAVESDGWDWDKIGGWITGHRCDQAEFERLAQERFGVKDEKQDKHKPVYKGIDVFDFMELELPERENLIVPILQTQGIAMLHAQRGIGKTFIALSIAHAVASGGNLFDRWEAPRPYKVGYIDGEMPARAMQDRLRAICAGAQSDITAREMLTILTPDLQDMAMPNLATEDGQIAVEDFIADRDFIILDNLATLARYGRSNDEESWQPIQEWLLSLRRRGKAVLAIHHEGKNGSQRGTSAKEDTMDTVIALKRPKDYDSSQGARFEVHYTKCRHVTGNDAKPFEAMLMTGNGHELIWTTKTIEDSELEQLQSLFDAGCSIRDAAQEMGVTKSRIEWLKKKLKK